MSTADKIHSVADARYFAKKRLPASIFQYFDGGSGPSVTSRLNEEAFQEVLMKPLSGVFHPTPDISTTVFGHEIDIPIILSSVGALKIGHQDGEIAATKAAGKYGTIQFLSGVSNTSIEETMRHATGPVYQQLYYIGGRDATAPTIERARDAGAAGLVIIADSAAPNTGREIPTTKRAQLPMTVNVKEAIKFLPQFWNKPAWIKDFVLRGGMEVPPVATARSANGQPMPFLEAAGAIYGETPTFEDIPWIREIWDAPIIVKGIVSVESARKAVEYGATGIVVSNHGGNMLDGTVPTLRALPEILEAVGDDIDVVVDGGIRYGTDVVKAMAMGAKAVSIGRGYVYGLLAAGYPGVLRMLELFKTETTSALTWLGKNSIHDVDPESLVIPPHWLTLSLDDLRREIRSRANELV